MPGAVWRAIPMWLAFVPLLRPGPLVANGPLWNAFHADLFWANGRDSMIGAHRNKMSPDELPEVCRTLMAEGARLQMAYAWFPEPGTPEVIYLADRKRLEAFSLVAAADCSMAAANCPRWPQSHRCSAGMRGKFRTYAGFRFAGHPEPGPLVLHEGCRASDAAPRSSLSNLSR